MDKYTKSVLTVIAASVLTTSVIAREVNDSDLNNLHALDLETEDLNFTCMKGECLLLWSIKQ